MTTSRSSGARSVCSKPALAVRKPVSNCGESAISATGVGSQPNRPRTPSMARRAAAGAVSAVWAVKTGMVTCFPELGVGRRKIVNVVDEIVNVVVEHGNR